jgi:hypothetical protein
MPPSLHSNEVHPAIGDPQGGRREIRAALALRARYRVQHPDAVERLIATGRLRPALRAPLDTGPLALAAGVRLPSETLLGDRADER